MSDRGISDVVAFTLMFGIIILSVSVALLVGTGELSELRDREQVNSGERGVIAFASSMDDLNRQGDPYRVAELSLGGGHVWVNESFIELQVVDAGTGTTLYDENHSVQSLEHRFDRSPRDKRIAYEGGAVFRSDGGTVRYEPAIRCAPDRGTGVVSVVNLSTDQSIHVSGSYNNDLVLEPTNVPTENLLAAPEQNVRILAELQNTSLEYADTDSSVDYELRMNVSSTANPEHWERYLARSNGWEYVSGTDGTYRCGGISTPVIRVTTIHLSR